MAVRKMDGDASIWEDCSWADLSNDEKNLWMVLGWTEKIWDTQKNVPASASAEWKSLSPREQQAATELGFTQAVWDEFEDQ